MANQGHTRCRCYLSVEVVAQGFFFFQLFTYSFPTFFVWNFICRMMLVLTCCFVMFLARSSHTSFISIFPPMCRNIAKQSFLETLQDNLIAMDILASAGRDASYNDGYVACSLSVRICFAMKTIVSPAPYFHQTCSLFLDAVSHECLSSLLPMFLLICVSSLFNTTNNGHPVICLVVLLLINVRKD